MACMKSVNRLATVALSPDAPYLTAGTVDLAFSTPAHIEIFNLDLESDDTEHPLVGGSTSSEGFNRLSWGGIGSNSEEFGLGLIAGALRNGIIGTWNPHAIIGHSFSPPISTQCSFDWPEVSANPLVVRLFRHQEPVRGLEFSSFTPQMLASGDDNGQIYIWDLNNPAEPLHFPLRDNGSYDQSEISYLSWNSKAEHILASASHDGTVVVWDTNCRVPIISLLEPNGRRCSVVQWNPHLATQLVVACDDDDSPVIRLWDVRRYLSPVKEFVGHNKGVISMSWGSSYLLTCGKDKRTICWDTSSREIVCELPAGSNWNFDAHWYPEKPGVISASSFDGKIGLYKLEVGE